MAASGTARKKKTFGPPVKFKPVALDEVKVEFGLKPGRVSYYGEALALLISGQHKCLCFEDVKCRGQLGTRAKKLGVSVLFAEQEGKLYVRMADDDVAASLVLNMIREMPRTKREIVAELSARNLHDIVPDKELKKLADNNMIVLGTDSRWKAIK